MVEALQKAQERVFELECDGRSTNRSLNTEVQQLRLQLAMRSDQLNQLQEQGEANRQQIAELHAALCQRKSNVLKLK